MSLFLFGVTSSTNKTWCWGKGVIWHRMKWNLSEPSHMYWQILLTVEYDVGQRVSTDTEWSETSQSQVILCTDRFYLLWNMMLGKGCQLTQNEVKPLKAKSYVLTDFTYCGICYINPVRKSSSGHQSQHMKWYQIY